MYLKMCCSKKYKIHFELYKNIHFVSLHPWVSYEQLWCKSKISCGSVWLCVAKHVSALNKHGCDQMCFCIDLKLKQKKYKQNKQNKSLNGINDHFNIQLSVKTMNSYFLSIRYLSLC